MYILGTKYLMHNFDLHWKTEVFPGKRITEVVSSYVPNTCKLKQI